MWTATTIDQATDVQSGLGVAVTVAYTNGTLNRNITHRAITSVAQLSAAMTTQVNAFNDADALAAVIAAGGIGVAPPLSSSQIAALKPFFNSSADDPTNMAALNALSPSCTLPVPVPLSSLYSYVDAQTSPLDQRPLWLAIQAGQTTGTAPAQNLSTSPPVNPNGVTNQNVMDACTMAVVMRGGLYPTVDMTQAAFVQSLGALVVAGILNATQQAAILAMGTQQVSRAVLTIGRSVTLGDMALLRGS